MTKQTQNPKPKTFEFLVVVFTFSFLIFTYPIFAQHTPAPIRVVTKADKKSIMVAQRFNYTVTVYAAPEVEIKFPEHDKTFGDFEIKEKSLRQKQLFGKNVHTLRYTLAIYKTAEQLIPEMEIQYREKPTQIWKSVKSDKIKIKVESIFTKTKITDDIKPIKSFVNKFDRMKIYLICSAAILILFGIVILIISLRRRILLERKRIQASAYNIAHGKLGDIYKKAQGYAGPAEGLYAELSDILREYIHKRFSFISQGATTKEMLSAVKDSPTLKEQQKRFLVEFFADCDLIKFASSSSDKEKISAYIKSAMNLVEDAKEDKALD